MIKNFSKNFKSSKKSALVFPTLLFLLFCPIMLNAQEYIVGVAVYDTTWPVAQIFADCPNDFLSFRLDSTLIPYVTGLTFQVEITATDGVVLSDIGDTVKVGDTFSLPAPNESGILKISFTQLFDSFSFFIKLVGTPEIAGETHYCNVWCSITLALCRNRVDIFVYDDSLCSVQSFPSSIDYPPELPTEYQLKQNYPNPFNPSTNILYSIPISNFVTLKVYDVLGKEIQTLVNEFQQPGNYSIQFDASELSSGIYFYRLHVGSNFRKTKKMLLMR